MRIPEIPISPVNNNGNNNGNSNVDSGTVTPPEE